ncbi:hypothetical protein [Streptomyces lunaelactis]|uniref:hypothetical protein n=1 Tax=Streptomyces lunaelactis TaxID=1535768 RepID=UPI00158575E5|nr:hypothetical protein [Streptomyces lunaelactis]NUK28459.1 hypothetical protein [Streptomyces lunaelactis]
MGLAGPEPQTPGHHSEPVPPDGSARPAPEPGAPERAQRPDPRLTPRRHTDDHTHPDPRCADRRRIHLEDRDICSPFPALALNFGYLPGEIRISDATGHTTSPGDHPGLWARYYPAPDNTAVRHDVCRSQLPDVTADTDQLLTALAGLITPASPQLAAQLNDYRSRLTHVLGERERWKNTAVLATFDTNTTKLRHTLERITISAIVDNARPCNN